MRPMRSVQRQKGGMGCTDRMHRRNFVEGENADPDYLKKIPGTLPRDDPLNEDGIGEKI